MAIRRNGWPLPSALMSISDLFKRQQNRKTFLLIFSKAQVAENWCLCVPCGPWLSYTLLTKIKFTSKTLVLLFTISPKHWVTRRDVFVNFFFKTLLMKIETGKYGLLLNLVLKGLSKILLAFPNQILTLVSMVFVCILSLLGFRKGEGLFRYQSGESSIQMGCF